GDQIVVVHQNCSTYVDRSIERLLLSKGQFCRRSRECYKHPIYKYCGSLTNCCQFLLIYLLHFLSHRHLAASPTQLIAQSLQTLSQAGPARLVPPPFAPPPALASPRVSPPHQRPAARPGPRRPPGSPLRPRAPVARRLA